MRDFSTPCARADEIAQRGALYWPRMRLERGANVDRYTLVEPIGEGGQARVWRVIDRLDAEAPRAAKLMDLSFAPMAAAERVRREARQLVRLEHPSLVRCHALFEDVHVQLLGVVMDYVEGCTVRQALEDARFSGRHRSEVLRHVARVLAHVHERGVVHRDLKPDNVLLTREFWDEPESAENVKLVDFGIASAAGNPVPLTQIGNVVGTPAYMAPEAIDPGTWPGGTAMAAVDVFAFGVLGWVVLTGGHPTELPDDCEPGAYGSAYRSIARAGAPWPRPHRDSEWTPILARCLRLNAAERPADGRDLVELIAPNEAVRSSQRTPPPVVASSSPTTRISGDAAIPQATEPGFPPLLQADPLAAARPPRPRAAPVALSLGALAVSLGALGAFSLRDRLSPPSDDIPPPSLAASTPLVALQPTVDTEQAKREAEAARKQAEEAAERAAAAERARMIAQAPAKVTVRTNGCKCESGKRIVLECTVANPSSVPMSVDLQGSARTSFWENKSSGASTVNVPAHGTKSVQLTTKFSGLMSCGGAKDCKCTKAAARALSR